MSDRVSRRCLILEKKGTKGRFDTLELAWRGLKDYLEVSGVQLTSETPRSVATAAFRARLIPGGQLWIDMLEHKKLLSPQSPAYESMHQFFEEQAR